VNDAPRRVLQVLRGAAVAPLVDRATDGADAAFELTTVAFDDVVADELLEQIFAADVVLVV
jgi:hypothetical protein